ncbi:MAG: hypothetical protein KBG84_03795 [Planctomycetes bacterium]|nr:hypothetical protein [Planctomycetota bacterium]
MAMQDKGVSEPSTMTIKVARKSYVRLQEALRRLTGRIPVKSTKTAELKWKSPSMQMLVEECLVRSLGDVVTDLKKVMASNEADQDFEIVFTPEVVKRGKSVRRA